MVLWKCLGALETRFGAGLRSPSLGHSHTEVSVLRRPQKNRVVCLVFPLKPTPTWVPNKNQTHIYIYTHLSWHVRFRPLEKIKKHISSSELDSL